VSQAALFPTNCRLLDGGEAAVSAGTTDAAALLVLGFESADHELGPWMARALELCEGHGGRARPREEGERSARERGQAEGAWRDAFLQAPYLRDTLVAAGIFVETFETAVTWDRFDGLVAGVRERAREALGGEGVVTCRLTHVYPDGAAPYFTVLAPARRGDELAQWDELKAAASEIILAAGGTITHHHAVGRDHRPWYDRQRPDPFADALRAAKSAVDPAGILNPGVLVDP
jgi:alkyldihydroxyacetonephosphate synthase